MLNIRSRETPGIDSASEGFSGRGERKSKKFMRKKVKSSLWMSSAPPVGPGATEPVGYSLFNEQCHWCSIRIRGDAETRDNPEQIANIHSIIIRAVEENIARMGHLILESFI